ncbi:MAG: hypothetical protein NT016_03905 [Candidatus Aenigmarchaeota archaeon]|nr:hypothetical protein [Candidatus Aenigmarchaeota archaeon]
MKPFCEIIVADVLPALRAIITGELSKEYGLTQVQVSKKLGISQPAVSQYRSELRGHNVRVLTSDEKVMSLVHKLTHDIALTDPDAKHVHKSLCAICRKIREGGLICKMHANAYPKIGSCRICLE